MECISEIFKKLKEVDEKYNTIYKLSLKEMNFATTHFIKLRKHQWHLDTLNRYIDSFAANNLTEENYNLWKVRKN